MPAKRANNRTTAKVVKPDKAANDFLSKLEARNRLIDAYFIVYDAAEQNVPAALNTLKALMEGKIKIERASDISDFAKRQLHKRASKKLEDLKIENFFKVVADAGEDFEEKGEFWQARNFYEYAADYGDKKAAQNLKQLDRTQGKPLEKRKEPPLWRKGKADMDGGTQSNPEPSPIADRAPDLQISFDQVADIFNPEQVKTFMAALRGDITQEELAERLKTTQSAISKIESSGKLPNRNMLKRISDATGNKIGISVISKEP